MSINEQIDYYLDYCMYQKRLSDKTLKAYRIDLGQFAAYSANEKEPVNKQFIEQFIQNMHATFKPKSVKRKIASLRAFLKFLEFEERITENPMNKIHLEFREPLMLPKSLSLNTIKKILKTAHTLSDADSSNYSKKLKLRNTAILELLFATGLRVSELCTMHDDDVDLSNGVIKVFGKGSRERIVFISNSEALCALRQYKKAFNAQIKDTGWFFINRFGRRMSEQSVRDMIISYTHHAKIQEHITPHMFRHSFATLMLEEDVDIRYIQSILGHSSITTTQIYTHVSLNKQRSIMRKKHPRNKFNIE